MPIEEYCHFVFLIRQSVVYVLSFYNFGLDLNIMILLSIFLIYSLPLIYMVRNRTTRWEKLMIIAGWGIKITIGAAFIYAYTHHYGKGKLSEDSGAYFHEAELLLNIKNNNSKDYYSILLNLKSSEELISKYFAGVPNSRFSRQSSGINDTRMHIKFISVLMSVVGTNHKVLFGIFFFLSYLGFVILWLKTKEQLKLNSLFAFCLLLLPPSLIFWTSSNLKEPLFILGLCLIAASFFNYQKRYSKKILLALGFILLLLFKPILVAILFTSWGVVLLFDRIIITKQWRYLYGLGLIITVLFIFSVPQKALKIISDKQFDFINVARGGIQVQGDSSFYYINTSEIENLKIIDSIVYIQSPIPALSNLFGKIRKEKKVILRPHHEKLKLVYFQAKGGSYFEINPIDNSFYNLFKSVPEAILNAFFRPFIWENEMDFYLAILFIENLFFFSLLLYSLFVWKKVKKNHLNLFFVIILSILSLSILIGLTTPISGALIRYRIPIQLLIIILFLMTQFKKEHAK